MTPDSEELGFQLTNVNSNIDAVTGVPIIVLKDDNFKNYTLDWLTNKGYIYKYS